MSGPNSEKNMQLKQLVNQQSDYEDDAPKLPNANSNTSSSKSISQAIGDKAKNQKRVQQKRMTADFLKNLPDGVTYIEKGSSQDHECHDTLLDNMDDDIKEGDIVRVGDFMINIEKVSKAQIISMRKFLPSEEYRLLKNRKSARLCRRKRKEERGDMQRTIDDLKRENYLLHERLEETKRQLKESENARVFNEQLMHMQLANMMQRDQPNMPKEKAAIANEQYNK